MAVGENIFNYFVGGLALLSTLFSMLLYLNAYLPGPQLKVFDELLLETKCIYEKAILDSLLPPDVSIEAQAQLENYESQGNDLRVITCRALSSVEIFLSFFRGHSTQIRRLVKKLMQLRATLLTTSQEELARRQEEHLRRERCETSTDSSFVTEESHSPGSHSFPPNTELASHTAESTDVTPSPYAASSHTPFYQWTFGIHSIRNWLSARTEQASPSLPIQSQSKGGRQPSISDIEACSRSSTLTEDPRPKILSMQRPWSLLGWWVRPVDAQARCEDLEGR